MKKVFALLAALTLTLGLLAACGDQPKETTAIPTQKATEASTTAPTEASASDDLEAAKDYIFAMYNNKALATPADYQVTAVVAIAGVKYDVAWSAEIQSGPADSVKIGAVENNQVTIDVNEQSPEEVSYNLVATVKDASGKTASVSFPHTIPAYKEFTWDEYVAAKEGDTVVVKGVISATMSKTRGNSSNCLYLQDNDGGYYVYNMADDPDTAGYKPGMTVRVTGSRSTYSGTYEIMNASVEVLDNGPAELDVTDLTEVYTNAASLKDPELAGRQAKLVTVKGVEITGQDTASGYYKFKLGALESYVRISSSVCPLTKDEQAKFVADHAEHLGWIANVTGVLCVYDGAFYLTPATVDCFEYVSLPEKSDAEKLAFEKENLSIVTTYKEAGEAELPAAGQGYENVAITWASDNEEVAKIEDGKLIVTPGKQDTVVKLTATLTVGESTDTKEFEVKVEAPAEDMSTAEILAKAFALAEDESLNGKQVLRGKITEIVTEYSEKYDNVTVNLLVTDEEHIIQAFRLIGGKELVVGDEITVTGILKNYKGTVEFDAKCTYSKELSVEEAKQAVVIEKLYALGEGESLNGTYVLRGTITEIVTEYSEKYDNVTVNLLVTDEEHPVQAYRLIGGKELKVGDVITVIGNLKNYKGTFEFDAKCTYDPEMTLEQAKQVITVNKLYTLEDGENMNGLFTLTGKITEIVTEYSEKYDNVTVNLLVTDEEHIVQAYRLIGGKDLKVGDVITVTGNLKNYKGTFEFDAKCTYVPAE